MLAQQFNKIAIKGWYYSSPAKLFDTRTFFPSFCPSNTPTTRFRVPLAARLKWSTTDNRTRGATVTFLLTNESVSAVVAGIVKTKILASMALCMYRQKQKIVGMAEGDGFV
jgi:hypothetical protein